MSRRAASPRPARGRAGALLTLVLLLGVLACSPLGDDDADDARLLAEEVAAALAAGDLSEVVAEDAHGLDHARVVAGIGTPAAVELDEVEVADEDDDGARSATAALSWTWELEPESWTYRSTLRLERPAPEGDQEPGPWEPVWEPAVVAPELEPGDRLRSTRLLPDRGPVVGAEERLLVEPRPVRRVGVDKDGLDAATARRAATRVAELVELDPELYVERVAASGERAFVEAIVLRVEDADTDLLERLESVEGARVVEDTLPLAPSREFAAPLLGTVGEATAELVEESDGAVRAGDEVGRSGLQLRYDEQLRGTPGVVVEAVSDARAARPLWRVEPVAGEPLRTTLDLDRQATAERLLADLGGPGALVALRPSTGEVLAAASGASAAGSTATFGQYAPGSTFKIVSGLALLRAGLDPTSPVRCTSAVRVDGRDFTNYSDYPSGDLGRVPLRTAFASSCNTAFIAQRDRLGEGDLASAAAALGLGVDHDLGFPAYFGQVPPATSETGAAADLIGQGTVLASPLAMASVVASVAAGETVLPRLLTDVEVERQQPEEPLRPTEVRALRGLMRAVVTEGSGRLLADLDGPPVLAKTGTAEYGEDTPPQTHAWMVAAQGDLAVAVFVETGESGSSTAGPVLRAFLEAER